MNKQLETTFVYYEQELKSFTFYCRMVNSILENELKEIHAFSQKTLTPEQWEKQQQQQ